MNIPSFLVPVLVRLLGRGRAYSTVENAKAHMVERSVRPIKFGPPKGIEKHVSISSRRDNGWPIYEIAPRDCKPIGNLIYVHGGGWVNDIAIQHWQLAARIAKDAGTTVTVPIYPLIPFANGAGVLDQMVQIAIKNKREFGKVAIAGDSAGGQIALSTALALRDRGETLATTVLISPPVDLTLTNPKVPAIAPSDPWLKVPGAKFLAATWAGDLELTDPKVSPLFADFGGLGPLIVYSGTRDILYPDVQLLIEKAKKANVEVDYTEAPGQVHVYPLLPTAIGAAARRDIVAKIANALTSDKRQ